MCDKCNDSGLIVRYSEEFQDYVACRCDCMKVKAVQNKLKNSGIPGDKVFFKDFNFGYYSNSEKIPESQKTQLQAARDAVQACKLFSQNPNDGILLVGPTGIGKTFLARATARRVLSQTRQELIFIVVPDLLDEIRDTFNKNSEKTASEILGVAKEVPILFLDDLGAHSYTDWVLTQLYTIVNYRANNNLPTFITTNLNLDEMDSSLGERTTSRIIDLCETHYMDSEDIRFLNRQQKTRNKAV